MTKIIALLLAGLFLFCPVTFSQENADEEKVAPEFSNFTGTLLILENTSFRDNTLNRMTEKRFNKNYDGEFEMIAEDGLKMKPYSDKNKFRFTVQLVNDRTVSRSGSSKGTATDMSKFVMTDRVTDKKYETRTYANWVTAMNQYSKYLEKVRHKQ